MVDIDVLMEGRGGKGMNACTMTSELYADRFSEEELELVRSLWCEFIKSLGLVAMRIWGSQVSLIVPGISEAASCSECVFLEQSHPSWVCYWSPQAKFYGRFV